MPVCTGCGASYAENFQFCPYCGRSKPAPQKIEVQVAVIDSGGAIACPSCGRSDQARKVSAVIASQTLKIMGTANSIDGSERYISTSTSELVKKLTVEQPRPTPPSEGEGMARAALLFWAFTFLVGLAALGRIISRQDAIGPLLITGLLAFFAVRLTSMVNRQQKNNSKTRAQYLDHLKQWEVGEKKRENLFYCERCDRVFLPREGRSAPVDDLREFVYQGSEQE